MEVDRSKLIEQAVALGYSQQELIRQPSYVIEALLRSKEDRSKEVKQHPIAPPEEAKDEKDDTRTVIDLTFARATNPIDSKYERFFQCHRARDALLHGIQKNEALLKQLQSSLDEEDILALRNEIEFQQREFQMVLDEMSEIQVWFQQVSEVRQSMYKNLAGSVVDVSGKSKDHFQRKASNIEKYMRNMMEAMKM